MTRSAGIVRRVFVVFSLVAACATLPAPSAWAQGDTNPANCNPITDPGTQLTADACSAHAGCALVLKIQQACTATKQFLTRLTDTKSLWNSLGLTSEDVFEAKEPELSPSPALESYATRVETMSRAGAQDPTRQKLEIKTDAGTSYYEGGVKNGQFDGAGVEIDSTGAMSRGQYTAGELNGWGESVTASGATHVGQFKTGQPEGLGATQDSKGKVSAGQFQRGEMTGTIDVTYADGSTQKDVYSATGDLLTEGPLVPPPARPVPVADDSGLPKRAASDMTGVFDEAIRDAEGPALAREAAERLAIETNEKALEAARVAAVAKAENARLAAVKKADADRLAAAEAARVQEVFSGTLKTAPAGELFALADELQAAGKTLEGKQALRALVSRFPDHPLAVVAAKQMTGGATPAAPRPSPAQPVAATAGMTCLGLNSELTKIAQRGVGGRSATEQAVSAISHPVRWFADPQTSLIVYRPGGGTYPLPVCSQSELDGLHRAVREAGERCVAAIGSRPEGAWCVGLPLNNEDQLQAEMMNYIRSGPSAAPVSPPPNTSASGRPFAECVAAETSSNAGDRLTALTEANPDNNNVIMRGVIVTIDALVGIYNRCLPDPRAKTKIDEMNRTRAQTLQTCRQISSDPNSCLVSPFR